jgi:hypothetical protein
MGAYLNQVLRHRGVVWLIGECQDRFALYGFPPENYRLIFRSMDRNVQGYVTYADFVDFCRILGYPEVNSEKSKSELIEMFKEFDHTSCGFITLASFTSGVLRSGIRGRREVLRSLQREAQYEKTFLSPPPEIVELECEVRKMITRINIPRIKSGFRFAASPTSGLIPSPTMGSASPVVQTARSMSPVLQPRSISRRSFL